MPSLLLNFVPPIFERRPLERGITAAFGRPFDQWRGMLHMRVSYLDPKAAPVEWVDWLLGVLGFDDLRGVTEERRRSVLASAMHIWGAKWSAEGIVTYLQALTGIPSSLETVNTSAFIAGYANAGDVCGPGVNAWRFELRRPAASELSDAELRRRLYRVVGAFLEYRICDVDGSACSVWGLE